MNGVDARMTEANEQHEPSYYEIALTNRQVMAAFVILLLCVLGAFFSGVWVGRGGKVDRHAASSASQAQTTPPGQPMQELQFFTPKSEKTPDKPPASSSPATSLANDLGKPAEPAADAGADQADPEPATAPTDTAAAPAPVPPAASKPAVPPATETAASAPSTASRTASSTAPGATNAGNAGTKPTPPGVAPSAVTPSTAPSALSPTTAKPAAPVVRTPELAPGEMVVQVFSSSDGEQAKKAVQRVNKGGFKAYVSPLQVGAQTMYRVRIGPFTDRASAQKVADQVRKRFKLDTWITR